MPGSLRGGTACAVLLAAGLAMPAVAMPRLQASESGCRDGDVAARLQGEALHLQLLPQRDYIGWLEESGVDVGLGVDPDQERRVDSAPARFAREPLQLRSAADGMAVLPLQVLAGGSGETGLELRLQCLDALPVEAKTHWRRLWRFVQARIDFQQAQSVDAPLRLFWHAVDLLSAGDAPAADRQWLLHQLAALTRGAGGLREAEGWYGLAAGAAGDASRRAALAELGRAQAAFGLGNPDAGERLRRVRERLQSLALSYPAAVAAHDGCLAQRVSGEIAAAVECLRAAAGGFADLGELGEQSNALRNRATALLMLGNYIEGERDLERAVQLAETAGDARQRSLAARIQAQLRTWEGDFEKALALLHGALQERERDGSGDGAVDAAHIRWLIAVTYGLAGETHSAVHYHRSALEFFEQRGLSFRAAMVRLALADAMTASASADEVGELLRSARSALRKQGSARAIARADLAWARWLRDSGRHADALLVLDELLDESVQIPWNLRTEAVLLRETIRPNSASERLAELQSQARQQGHFLLQLEVANARIEHLLRDGRVDAAVALADASLREGTAVAERLRSPALRFALLQRMRESAQLRLRLLEPGRIDPGAALRALRPLEMLRQLARERPISDAKDDRLIEIERRLSAELVDGADAPASAERERLMLAWYASLATDESDSDNVSDVVLQVQPGDETLLYFVQWHESAGVLRNDAQGWYWMRGLPVREVRHSASALRELLGGGHGDRERIDAEIGRLGGLLRWPEMLPASPRRLAIIADDELVAIPWEMLPTPEAPERPLLERSEMVVLHSLRPSERRMPRRLETVAAGSGSSLRLDALPRAQGEALAVAEAWPALEHIHHANANRRAFVQALSTPDGLLHVASHGRGDRGRSEESGLWLQGEVDPEFVSALGLRTLHVRSALVVLSACESGYGQGRRFGAGGVAGALLDAGAGAVVGSRWPVSDRVAESFAVSFHAALAQQPEAPAAALRAAKLDVRAQRRWRHPTHWAGWYLIEPGPPLSAVESRAGTAAGTR